MRKTRILAFIYLARAAVITVFVLYLQPEFMNTLAQQVWACFYAVCEAKDHR